MSSENIHAENSGFHTILYLFEYQILFFKFVCRLEFSLVFSAHKTPLREGPEEHRYLLYLSNLYAV